MNRSRRTTKVLTVLLLGGAIIAAVCSLRGGAHLVDQGHRRMPSSEVLAAGADDAAARSRAQALLGKLPLYFIENSGQEDPRVAYYLQGRDTAVYFTGDGVTFALSGRKADGPATDRLAAGGDDARGGHGPRA